MMDKNLAGQKMTDIYVRAFLRGMEGQRQKTDVHYRYGIEQNGIHACIQQ